MAASSTFPVARRNLGLRERTSVRVKFFRKKSRQMAYRAQILRRVPRRKSRTGRDQRHSFRDQFDVPPRRRKGRKTAFSGIQVAPVKTTPVKTGRSQAKMATVDEYRSNRSSSDPKIFVQAGAFSQFQNAHEGRAVLKQLGPKDYAGRYR